MIRLSRKELKLVNGVFYIVENGKQPIIATPKVDIVEEAQANVSVVQVNTPSYFAIVNGVEQVIGAFNMYVL